MRESYTGKEVSVAALRPLIDQLQDPELLQFVDRLVPGATTRVSWDVMCDLLDHCDPTEADARGIGAEAIRSSACKYRGRLQFVSRIFGLEQILRFMVFPRDPIDFSCVSHAVSGEPGRVDV